MTESLYNNVNRLVQIVKALIHMLNANGSAETKRAIN